jgi:hypothetical protein
MSSPAFLIPFTRFVTRISFAFRCFTRISI